MEYRCIASSPEGFVQQLAVAYLAHGYWFYVQGYIPEHKEPIRVDEKLVLKYGIGNSRSARARRKNMGIANIHYIRFDRTFVLLATHGHHPFYDNEHENIRDARRVPIKFMGYSISVQRGGHLRKTDKQVQAIRDGRWRVRVQICRDEYQRLKGYFVANAINQSAEALASKLFLLPFEPYAPVRQQMLNIMRLMNEVRRRAGKQPLSYDVLRYRRRIVKPFGQPLFEVA